MAQSIQLGVPIPRRHPSALLTIFRSYKYWLPQPGALHLAQEDYADFGCVGPLTSFLWARRPRLIRNIIWEFVYGYNLQLLEHTGWWNPFFWSLNKMPHVSSTTWSFGKQRHSTSSHKTNTNLSPFITQTYLHSNTLYSFVTHDDYTKHCI